MPLNLPASLSDHPSLVGIIRFPTCTYEYNQVTIPMVTKNAENKWENVTQTVFMATTITGGSKESSAFTVPKASVTDFFPYTYYVLTDNETEPLIMYPQYLPSSFTVKGKFALSNQPIDTNSCSLNSFHTISLLFLSPAAILQTFLSSRKVGYSA